MTPQKISVRDQRRTNVFKVQANLIGHFQRLTGGALKVYLVLCWILGQETPPDLTLYQLIMDKTGIALPDLVKQTLDELRDRELILITAGFDDYSPAITLLDLTPLNP